MEKLIILARIRDQKQKELEHLLSLEHRITVAMGRAKGLPKQGRNLL